MTSKFSYCAKIGIRKLKHTEAFKVFIYTIFGISLLHSIYTLATSLGFDFPIMEDESTFIVDSSNGLNLYTNSNYMKPPLGALFYQLAFLWGGYTGTTFIFLRVLTLSAIAISSILIYKTSKLSLKHAFLPIVGVAVWIAICSIKPDGFHHASLDIFATPFILSSIYFMRTGNETKSIYSLLIACLIKQNFALGFLAFAVSRRRKRNLFHILIALALAIFLISQYPDWWRNLIDVPIAYRGGSSIIDSTWSSIAWLLKAYATYPIFFLFFITFSCSALAIILQIRVQKNPLKSLYLGKSAALETLILASILIGSPFYFHHSIPFFAILCLAINESLRYNQNILVLATFVVCMPLLYPAPFFQPNQEIVFDKNFVSNRYSAIDRKIGTLEVNQVNTFFESQSNKTAYFYPIPASHLYFAHGLSFPTFHASNDQIGVTLESSSRIQKLLSTLREEKIQYLVRLKKSSLDSHLIGYLDEYCVPARAYKDLLISKCKYE